MASLPASAWEKLNLQSNMKADTEGYSSEVLLFYDQFKAALNYTSLSGISAAKDLGDLTMFLTHVTPFYPKELAKFPTEIVSFLESSARSLPSGLRVQLTQALILLINRKIIGIAETLQVFMVLQTVGDRVLQQLAFSHVVQSIKNDLNNKALQDILFGMLQQEDAAKAEQALITLCDLHRRKVWSDDRTANAICMACLNPSSRIMIAALSFLLDIEKIQDGDSDNEDDHATPQPQIVLNKDAMYKASHKGTTSSKKKKKAKLQRIVRSMKKQQRLSSEKSNTNYCSPLNHLKDAQGFSEKLFSRLQSMSNERLEVEMMMIKVIARTVGLHRLILLDLYPYLQKYVQPHERDVTTLLAAAIQACHELVPPDAVESLFKQIVDQFVLDRTRPEAITVGLNVVREICLRMPLLMTEELLQTLILYTNSHEKAVSVSARSLLTLFREICPSLLVKKDRGRPAELKTKPKDDDSVDVVEEDGRGESDGGGSIGSYHELDYGSDEDDEISDDDVNNSVYGASEISDEEESEDNDGADEYDDIIRKDADVDSNKSKEKKRKFSDFEGQFNAATNSLLSLKKLGGTAGNVSSSTNDRILSNEDFERIRELKAQKDARTTLTQHGFKLPSSDQLRLKRVDAATLEAHIKKKLTKEEKMVLVREGREGTKYQSRRSLKNKKIGGLTNRQKEHKKLMPYAARKAKIARTRQEKKIKHKHSVKQFRGRKAWK